MDRESLAGEKREGGGRMDFGGWGKSAAVTVLDLDHWFLKSVELAVIFQIERDFGNI